MCWLNMTPFSKSIKRERQSVRCPQCGSRAWTEVFDRVLRNGAKERVRVTRCRRTSGEALCRPTVQIFCGEAMP